MKKVLLALAFATLFINLSCKDNKPEVPVEELAVVREWKPEDTRSLTEVSAKRGLILNTDEDTEGYVLYEPSLGTSTYLIDKDGNVVHTWESDLNSMDSYLMPNGHLFRLERDENFPTFASGGQAGRIREFDWEGNKVWDFKYFDEKTLLHHDFEIMPNGNILAISYDAKTVEEAVAAGRDTSHIPKAGIWPDKIIEIEPIRPEGGKIVWEWKMWDHLVQDIDSTKANYGKISDNPRKININTHGEEGPPMNEEQIKQMIQVGFMTNNATIDNQGSDITHMNAISYNPELDQIVVSVPAYSEIFIIDHSTTTNEAKGSNGGKWGHGGDLLYRWGNPKNYGRGTEKDQKLFFQHDAKWIHKGYPGEGNITVYNNDIINPESKYPNMFAAFGVTEFPEAKLAIKDMGNYSSVVELDPQTAENGAYEIPETEAIGPEDPSWTYIAPDKYSFYSAFISGAQRLKNGNTLITQGMQGRFFEVTPEGEIVWEYWTPYKHNYTMPDGTRPQPTGAFIFGIFRSTLHNKDYEAFNGKELKPIDPQPETFVFKMPPKPQESTSEL